MIAGLRYDLRSACFDVGCGKNDGPDACCELLRLLLVATAVLLFYWFLLVQPAQLLLLLHYSVSTPIYAPTYKVILISVVGSITRKQGVLICTGSLFNTVQ